MTLQLGMVRPGSTIVIPFHTFTSDDPTASVAIADFVLADIGIYKDLSTDERASTTGVVLLDTNGIDLDGAVGIGGFSIDLSSDATAGFYSAGSHYHVTVGPVTIDLATVNFVAATFSIGFSDAMINTTVASATSDTQFILTDGPAEADVLIGCPILIQALAGAAGVGIQIGYCSDYIVTTKEVFLEADPGGGTVTAADHIAIYLPSNVRAWRNELVPAPATTGVPDVNTTEFLDTPVVLSNGLPDTNVENWLGAIVTAAAAGVPNVNTTTFLNVAVAAATASGEINANVTEFAETAVVLSNGLPDVNVENWLGTIVTAALAGRPDVNTAAFLNTAVVLSNGLPDTNVENWLGTIVTAALAGRPDINVAALDNNTNAAAVLSDSLQDGVIGTADSGTTTSITDAARTEADDRFNGWELIITSGLSAGQSRLVTDFANTGGVITFAPAVTVNLDTETYVLKPRPGVDVQSWLGTESAMVAPNALVGGTMDSNISQWDSAAIATPTVAGVPEVDITHVEGATTLPELGVGVPSITPGIAEALMLLYMALRNKLVVQTSGTDALEIHNDADTLITKKLITDDGDDYTEAKMS